MQYEHITIPADGQQDHRQSGRLDQRAGPADHPVHRRRWHRHRRDAGDAQGGQRRRPEGVRQEAQHRVDGGLQRREGERALRPVVSGRDAACLRDFVVSIKGPLGTPVGGGIRSLNVAMRQSLDLYACVRPIRYFPGVAMPDAGREPHGHGGVPREHRGHLRRHRMARGVRGSAEAHHLPAARAARDRHPLPGELRHRHQARVEGRQPAPDPQGHPVRHRQRSRLGDAGPQGQHHEVHGRRLPELGLPAREGGIRRARDRRRAVALASRARSRARTS